MTYIPRDQNSEEKAESRNQSLWHSIKSNRFERGYANLSDEMAKRADNALRTLLSSQRPEELGDWKKGPWRGYFSWELGRSCRLIYRPDYDERVIFFPRICSHKETYGP